MQRRHERGEERARLLRRHLRRRSCGFRESRANSIRRGIHGGEREVRRVALHVRERRRKLVVARFARVHPRRRGVRVDVHGRDHFPRLFDHPSDEFVGEVFDERPGVRRGGDTARRLHEEMVRRRVGDAGRRSMSFDTGTCARTARAHAPAPFAAPPRWRVASPTARTTRSPSFHAAAASAAAASASAGAPLPEEPNSGEKNVGTNARDNDARAASSSASASASASSAFVARCFALSSSRAFAAGRNRRRRARASGPTRRSSARAATATADAGSACTPTSRAVHAAAADLRRSRTRSAASAAASAPARSAARRTARTAGSPPARRIWTSRASARSSESGHAGEPSLARGAAAGLVGPGFEGGDAAEGGVGGDARGGAGVQGAELGGDSRELPRRDHARLAVHSERRAERRVALHHRPGVLHERQRRALRRVRGGGGSRV